MTVSMRARFEIFKRDRFTCAYCGRTPPDVLLHVDHVIPQADGGGDEPENLVTSCQDCNLGKGARRLDASLVPRSATVEDLEERIAQATAYAEVLRDATKARRSLDDQIHDLVLEAWSRAWGGTGIPVADEAGTAHYYQMPNGGYWPDWRSVKNIIRRLPLELVYDAIEITAGHFPKRAEWDSTRYFYGVCWRMIRERSGEVTE